MTAKTIQACADEWKELPWKQFQKNLFRLQHRIFKAAKKDDFDSVKRLQSLLLGSKCSKYLAVRQVTQLNAGKKTAGVNGVKSLNPKKRLQLVTDLDSMRNWKHRKLRRVSIPKPNGKQRLVVSSTVRDRAMQCLLKYALEPVYESYASYGSYDFRPRYSTWDVQNRLFQNLKSNWNGSNKTILEVDTEGCFDNLSHEKMMSLSILPGSAKKFLRTALEAGVLKERTKNLVRTSQGGVISPILCNIALHGIEDLNNVKIRGQNYQRGLRYANAIVYILPSGECGETLLKKVKDFLAMRGLKADEAKTRIGSTTKGFDFLGWHFRVKAKNHKFIIYPSQKNRKQMVVKLKNLMRNSRYKIGDRLKKAKIIYRGWWNYHQFSDLSQVNLWSIRYWMYKYLKKSTKIPSNRIIMHLEEIFNGHTYHVNRHNAICGNKLVYDGDLIYWPKKNAKH
jgi:group II intron reverse transcriptase/maturase